MKASVVHGNLTPRNKTPHRNAKYLRFTPPILPPLRTLVPISQRRMVHSTGSLQFTRKRVGHHDGQKPADASWISLSSRDHPAEPQMVRRIRKAARNF
jgi:hypothetical protein